MKNQTSFFCSALFFAIVSLAFIGHATDLELSWDNGSAAGGIHYTFSNYSLGVDYDTPPGGPWYLKGIKYSINNTWPQQGHGFNVYAMKGPDYEAMIFGPVFNHNYTGPFYNWITQDINPKVNLTESSITNFLCAVNNPYSYPYECESLSVDGNGVGPHDWFCMGLGGSWKAQPQSTFGRQMIRALLDDVGNTSVETTTIGQIRVLYR